MVAEHLTSTGIFLLFFIMSARMLSAEAFGVAALVITIWQMLQPLVEALFHDALIQRPNLEERDGDVAFTATLFIACALAALLLVLAPVVAAFTNAPGVEYHLPWVGLSLVGLGFSAVPTALARRCMRFRAIALASICARFLATLVGIVLLFAGWGAAAVIVQSVLGATLASVLLMLIFRPRLRAEFDMRRLLRLARFAGPAVVAQLLHFSGARLFTLLIASGAGPAGAAAWSVALRFVEPVQAIAATALSQLALPHYSRRAVGDPDYGRTFLTDVRCCAAILIPLFIGIGACAPELITLLVGERWHMAAPVLLIVSIVFALVAARQLSEIVLISLGAPHLSMSIQLSAMLASLAGFFVCAPLGIVAGICGWSARLVPTLILSAIFVERRIRLPAIVQAGALAPALVAAAAMLAGVWLVRASAPSHWSTLALLTALILSGAAIYLLIILTLSSATRQDIGRVAARYQMTRAR